jgi:hypothetical protein
MSAEDEMTQLTDVLHILVDRVRWFSEAARDNAHAIVERARAAANPEPKPAKAAKPPRSVPPTDA